MSLCLPRDFLQVVRFPKGHISRQRTLWKARRSFNASVTIFAEVIGKPFDVPDPMRRLPPE
jgi:hypothetical protein